MGSPARTARRQALWDARGDALTAIAEAGFETTEAEPERRVRVLMPGNGHVDFYPISGQWRQSRRRRGKAAFGRDLTSLLVFLTGGVVEPPQLNSKRRRQREKDAAKIDRIDPVCVECGTLATEVVGGLAIYPHRPDLYNLRFLRCTCGAYVGFHKGTDIPLGRPGGAETNRARHAAHRAFDPLWQRKIAKDGCTKTEARGAGYAWLAEQLGIDPRLCHIGMMDRATALRVVEVCHVASRRVAA